MARYCGNDFEWDYMDDNRFVWTKTKKGTYRIWERVDTQGTTGGGTVLNGQYTMIENVLRDLDYRILDFKTIAEAEIYASKLKTKRQGSRP